MKTERIAELRELAKLLQEGPAGKMIGAHIGECLDAIEVSQAELDYRRAASDGAPDSVLDPLWDAFDALRVAKGGV